MIDLFAELLIGVVVGIAAYGAIRLLLLTFDVIRNWFRERRMKSINTDKLAVTIKENLSSGKIKIVAGFFDEKKQEFTEAQVFEGEKIDKELSDVHKDSNVVVYQ